MTRPVTATDVLPAESDLPGTGWVAIDEGFGAAAGAGGDVAELLDCVGPGFPAGDEVVDTAATPHWVRAPGRLIHGVALTAASADAADRAADVLRSPAFAECLGRSVAADLDRAEVAAEMLTVDTTLTRHGNRVRFTAASPDGVRPVELDVVCVRAGLAVGLVWFADTPHPFDEDDVDAVLRRIRRRAPGS